MCACVPMLASANNAVNETTEPKTSWVDEHHQRIATQVDDSAKRIDGWFRSDQVDHENARATLKLYVDNNWNEYTGIQTKVRVRGKVHLPNMSERLKLVFGDDSLDDETQSDITRRSDSAISNQKIGNNTDLPELDTIEDSAKDDNASIALRYARTLYDKSSVDLDLGLRSGGDIYTRARLGYKKPLNNSTDSGWLLELEPTIRYGTNSKFYAQQLVRFSFRPEAAAPNNQWFDTHQTETLLRYAELENVGSEPIGARWSQRFTLHRDFGAEKTVDYGVQADGRLKDTHGKLDSYGLHSSYRQPLFREWFYVRGDVNYLKDRRLNRDWHPSVFVRLESHF